MPEWGDIWDEGASFYDLPDYADTNEDGSFDILDLQSLFESGHFTEGDDTNPDSELYHMLQWILEGNSSGVANPWGFGMGEEDVSGLTGQQLEQQYDNPDFLWQTLFDELLVSDEFGGSDVWGQDTALSDAADASNDNFERNIIRAFKNTMDSRGYAGFVDGDPDWVENGEYVNEGWDTTVETGMDIYGLMGNPDMLDEDMYMMGATGGFEHKNFASMFGQELANMDWGGHNPDFDNAQIEALLQSFKDKIDQMGEFDMGEYQSIMSSLGKKTGANISGMLENEELLNQQKSEDLYKQAMGGRYGKDTRGAISGGDIFSGLENNADSSVGDRIASQVRKLKGTQSVQYQQMASDWEDIFG